MSDLKPCGTRAAAQRHRRRGEEVCGDCKAAERDHRRKYARAERGESTVETALEGPVEVVDFGSGDVFDPLVIYRQNLDVVTKTLQSDQCLPKDIVPLTKRREELAQLIQEAQRRKDEETADAEVADDEEWDEAAI